MDVELRQWYIHERCGERCTGAGMFDARDLVEVSCPFAGEVAAVTGAMVFKGVFVTLGREERWERLHLVFF
jgi:hypothetical protein